MLIRFALAVLFAPVVLAAQPDSVDVTFVYAPAGSPSLVHLAGEFNNWANNSGGSIVPGAAWTMEKLPDGSWAKTVRLRVGGGTGPGGSYQYKFNENGVSGGWLADPRNPRTSGSYGNSIIYVRKPTVFQIRPVDGSIVQTAAPTVIAGVFPPVGGAIDTAASRVLVNGRPAASFGSSFDAPAHVLMLTLPPQADGDITVAVLAVDSSGAGASDSVRLTIKASPLQLLTRSNPHVYDSVATVRGLMLDPGITAAAFVRNGTDTIPAAIAGTTFSAVLPLSDGANIVHATATLGGRPVSTDDVTLTRIVNHTPAAVISLGGGSGTFSLSAVQSTDPDGDQLSFTWVSEDSLNPSPLGMRSSDAIVTLAVPQTNGEYFFRLEARDPSGNTGIARNYVTVAKGAAVLGGVNGNPQWVKDAVVYEIFVPALSPSGTIRGVIDRLPMIRDLGATVLWLMPIMNNRGTVNEFNGGYDIIDFTDVDESLGTLADVRELIDSCHAHGQRVVLDITPNHCSAEHPWVTDIRRWRDESSDRGYIENRLLGDARDLGQSVTYDNGYPLYAHYSNWALANLNLSDPATRAAMMDVFRFWVRDMKADGFRMDVYWGPQNRYGAAAWWRPFREEIKRIKPDILVIGETDGTGTGTEINYADGGGAMDAGYDWNWYGQIKATLSAGDVANLNARTINYSPTLDYNYYSGADALYMRFLENHDEDRIASIWSSNVDRTRPAATLLLTAPGLPMIYAGQEVGWQGRRNRIDFTGGTALRAYYKKLIGIRERFAAFRSPQIKSLANAASATYTFLRPFTDGNAICALSFSPTPGSVRLDIAETDLRLGAPLSPDATYYLNDVLNDTAIAVRAGDLRDIRFTLQPFQSRVFIFSDSAFYPVQTGSGRSDAAPGLQLGQNFPNPATATSGTIAISYGVPSWTPSAASAVDLSMYDTLGRHIRTLVHGTQAPGTYVARFSPEDAGLTSGVFVYRLTVLDPKTGRSAALSKSLVVLP